LIVSVFTKSAISWFHQNFNLKQNFNNNIKDNAKSEPTYQQKSFGTYLAKYTMYSTAIMTAHGLLKNIFIDD
jgi:hypothetical protein